MARVASADATQNQKRKAEIMTNPRTDLYSRVTNCIIAELEKGVRPWLKPWNAQNAEGRITRPLRANGQPYKGINVLMLWGEAVANGYNCPIWMTYKQAQELGAQVRKGEHGSLVVYADRMRRTDTNDNGDETEHEIPFLKGYTVFNCDQIDGLPDHFYIKPAPPLSAPARIEAAEHFTAATRAGFRHGGNRAFYAIDADRVQVPPFESFADPESYYATLLHELTHWTRHPTRLAREFGRKRWGDEGYAAEELVAELGAAFLCADLALTLEPRPDHASYIASWLTVLKNDKRAIFTAAAYAQRAADYLHGLQQPAGLDAIAAE
jgi:antirestriction protein ArdC